jgi:hypothetical protein
MGTDELVFAVLGDVDYGPVVGGAVAAFDGGELVGC